MGSSASLATLTGRSTIIASRRGTMMGSTFERMYASFSALPEPFTPEGTTLAAMVVALALAGCWSGH